MDLAATRHQSRTRHAAADDAGTPSLLKVGEVTWRGDEPIIRQLYEHGFETLCRGRSDDFPAAECATPNRVTTIKSGPHRTVFRFELPSGAVFVKHFKAAHWWDAIRNTIRGTQSAREARAAEQVQAAGIDTIECVAVGFASRGPLAGESYLASRAISNVTPLDQLVRNPCHAALRTPAFRRELARALGRLCGRLHRAGLVHRDLHPANLLAEVNSDGRVVLTLIDLQGVRPRRRWGTAFRRSARARWDLFGLFNFFRNAGRSDRCRFLNAYLREAGALHVEASPPDSRSSWVPLAACPPMRSFETREGNTGGQAASATVSSHRNRRSRVRLGRQIEAFCRKALRREQLRYDKKWQRSNRRLIVADSGGVVCRGLAVLGIDQVLELRANPDTLFRPDRIRFWLRRTAGERVAVVDLWAAGTPLRCEALETSRALGWRDLFPRFRWSSTRRAWEMAHALARRGVSTPRILLYLQARSVSQIREIVVTERSGRRVPLTTFLAHQFSGLSSRQRETWIKTNTRLFASELARMHEFSLIHRDLSASDISVGVDASEAGVHIGGADRIERKRFLSQRRSNHMLGQLAASLAGYPDLRRTHRLRFFKKYLGGHFAAQWKPLWRTIANAQPHAASAPARRPIGEFVARRRPRAAAILLAIALVFSGCQAVDHPVALPVKHQVKCEQLLVLSDFKLQKDHELIRELSTLREQEARLLELPLHRDPVVVYLFNNETEYRKYMAVTYPKLPPRSAYFVGSSTELAVFTHWGQSVREDLRHEYTHGLLHSAMKRVPLWLDEGLAEYFEVSGPQPGGINREYATKLSALLAQGWRPNLKRLEALGDDAQMRRSDYQEAWAWVHFMLHGSPEAKHVLLSYLKDLRTIPDPKPISKRLALECPDFQERSMSYMARLAPERQVVEAL